MSPVQRVWHHTPPFTTSSSLDFSESAGISSLQPSLSFHTKHTSSSPPPTTWSPVVYGLIYLFPGLGCLSQLLSSTQLFSATLTHLDLSANPGSLVTEDATVHSAPCVFHVKSYGLKTDNVTYEECTHGYIYNTHTVCTHSEIGL